MPMIRSYLQIDISRRYGNQDGQHIINQKRVDRVNKYSYLDTTVNDQ